MVIIAGNGSSRCCIHQVCYPYKSSTTEGKRLESGLWSTCNQVPSCYSTRYNSTTLVFKCRVRGKRTGLFWEWGPHVRQELSVGPEFPELSHLRSFLMPDKEPVEFFCFISRQLGFIWEERRHLIYKILRNLVRKVPSSVKAEFFAEGKLTVYMDYTALCQNLYRKVVSGRMKFHHIWNL